MKLSELYLSEDALEDLNIELGLMQLFGISHPEAEYLAHWMEGRVELSEGWYDFLMDFYAGEIPYLVAKDMIPISPEEWFHEKITAAIKRMK